ncbi:protein-lysine N-methyltransferase SMYD4 isoform X2 [Vanacampus margaritifer]
MDLPCVPWQDHVAQKWAGLEPEFRERFKSLLEIQDVFEGALSVTTQDDVKCLRSISAEAHRHTQKDGGEASACRERGNASFKSRKYTEAALHYSQGVCLSPRSSEQLSLCYANRSAALYHLQRYQESLDDVSEAERSGYPSALAHKLEKRRAQCLARLSPSDARADQKERSGMSPKVTVQFNPEKGRHAVASETIAPGEVILSERPYGLVLVASGGASGCERRRCHACLKQTWRLVACGGCSYARYCGARCRDAAWEQHHRWECPLGARLAATGVLAQLALRVALKAGIAGIRAAAGEVAAAADSPAAAYASVFHLLHHLERHSASMRFLCAVTVATLHLELGATGPPPGWRMLAGAALRHLLQLRCNAQAVIALQERGLSDAPVQSIEERRVATAVYPKLSLLNHSCRPNTSLTFGAGGAVTLRAASSIHAGREVAHCYGPHSGRMVAGQRRRLLQEQYFFLCGCEACADGKEEERSQGGQSGLLCAECNTSLLPSSGGDHSCGLCGGAWSGGELSEMLQDIRRDLDAAGHLLESDKPGEAAALLERSRTRRRAGVTLAHTHELCGHTEDAVARAHAAKGDWSRAAEHLERSGAAIAARFGADSVEMARQVAKLAQLHFNASVRKKTENVFFFFGVLTLWRVTHSGSRAAALSVIPEARRLLSLHCGALCPEVQELQAMEDCLRC